MEGDTYIDSESEADIPILLPVPFEELSSIQYYTPEEQLIELTAALKNQFQRHCFIQIHQEDTEPMLVPFVKERRPQREKNLQWYKDKLLTENKALPAAEVDALIESEEDALLKEVRDSRRPLPKTTQKPKKTKKPSSKRPLPFKDLIDPEEGSDD